MITFVHVLSSQTMNRDSCFNVGYSNCSVCVDMACFATLASLSRKLTVVGTATTATASEIARPSNQPITSRFGTYQDTSLNNADQSCSSKFFSSHCQSIGFEIMAPPCNRRASRHLQKRTHKIRTPPVFHLPRSNVRYHWSGDTDTGLHHERSELDNAR